MLLGFKLMLTWTQMWWIRTSSSEVGPRAFGEVWIVNMKSTIALEISWSQLHSVWKYTGNGWTWTFGPALHSFIYPEWIVLFLQRILFWKHRWWVSCRRSKHRSFGDLPRQPLDRQLLEAADRRVRSSQCKLGWPFFQRLHLGPLGFVKIPLPWLPWLCMLSWWVQGTSIDCSHCSWSVWTLDQTRPMCQCSEPEIRVH